MRRCTNSAVRLFYFVGILFEVGYKLTQVRCRKILSCHDYGGRMRGEADWFEVARGIVLDIWRKHRRGDVRSHAPSQQRIAIRLCGGDACASQRAAGAADVLNDHLLAKRPAHMLCHDTRDDVTWAAGREWDNHHNRSNWIDLRLRKEWHDAESSEGHQRRQLDHGGSSRLAPQYGRRGVPRAI